MPVVTIVLVVGCWLLSVGEMLDDDQVVVEK